MKRNSNIIPLDRLKNKKQKLSKPDYIDNPRLQKKKLTTYFGDHSDTILEMLEGSNQDGALTLLKRNLLKTVINALPHAEQILIESGTSKGTYQFATLISTIRELIADIQADQDKKFISEALLNNVLKPAYVDIAQNMLSKHFEFLSLSKDLVLPKSKKDFNTAMKTLATDIAADLKVSYKETASKITDHLKS
jgi:hypothetical protein